MKLDYTPTVSVIIPTYNRANMIIPCVESVLAQSYPVNEIIVVDDSSTDDTIKQLIKFKDGIIILKTEKRSGAQAARNIGIKAAKSEWIAFLDSDDEWLPNKMEKQISALKRFNFDQWTVVHGDCYIKNINSDKKKHWQLDGINGENVYKQLLSKSNTLFPAILTSKNALTKINFLDENAPSYHEWDTAIRLAKHCRFIHIQEPLFIYNIHKNTISNNKDNDVTGYQYIINKFEYKIKKFCGNNIFDKHIELNAVMAINNGKYKLGRQLLKKINDQTWKHFLIKLLSYFTIKPKYLISLKSILMRKK